MPAERDEPAAKPNSPWPARLLLLLAVGTTLGGIMLPAETMHAIRDEHRSLSRLLSWMDRMMPDFGMVHALLFAWVTLCLGYLWPRRPRWQIVAAMVALAVCSELLQFLVPGRRPRFSDIGDDLVGIALGLLLAGLLRHLHRPALAGACLAAARWLAVIGLFLLPLQRLPWGGMATPTLQPADVGLLLSLAFRGLAALGGVRIALGTFHAWLGAYVLLMAVGVVSSPQPGFSAGQWSGIAYLALVALLFADLGSDATWFRRLVLAWLAGAVGVALLALGTAVASWALPEARAWYEPLMAVQHGAAWGWLPRIRATFTSVHEFGSFLCIALALVFACARLDWCRPRPAGAAGIILVAAAALTWSPAIGGLALVVAALAGAAATTAPSLVLRAVRLAGIGVAGALLLVVVLDPAEPWGRASMRVQEWRAALEAIASHPWSGSGLGMPWAGMDGPGLLGWRRLDDAHDVWLSVAAQAGLAAAVSLAGLVHHLLRRGPGFRGLAPDTAQLGRALWWGFAAAWLYHGLTASIEGYLHLWIFMGLLAAHALSRTPEAAPPREHGARLPSSGM